MAAVMAKRRRKHLGRPPLWCLVFFDHCALSGEAAAVFLALPAPPDDCGAHSVRVVEEEAHPVAVKLRALRPAMRTFPPNLHAKRRTLVGAEQSRLIPERVAVHIVFEDRIAVSPSDARHVGDPLTRDAQQVRGAVSGVVHRRKTVSPCALSAVEKERLQPRMMILALTRVNPPERALLLELPCGDGQLLVVTGLGHHVGQARLL